MIVVKLMGGLGNQMFQYAAGRRLAHVHNTSLKLDLSFLLDRTPRKNFTYRDYELGIFNIQEKFVQPYEIPFLTSNYPQKVKIFLYEVFRLLNPQLPIYITEKEYQFNTELLKAPDNSYIEGYWHSENYFKDIENIIRKEFSFNRELNNENQELVQKISGSNSVCVHVRRGDFVTNSHIIVDENYFIHCVRVLGSKLIKPHFFVFSDDIQWCKSNLHFDFPHTFIHNQQENASVSQHVEHFKMMTLCKNFIISNSTFSWWAAWLSNNTDKIVFVPKNWSSVVRTNGLIPNQWVEV